MTQGRLAALVREEIYNATGKESVISAKSISDWERGLYTWPPAYVRRALCRVLQKADAADLGFFSRRRVRAARGLEPSSLVDLMDGQPPEAGSENLRVPAGRSFAGVEIEAHYCEVTMPSDRWLIADPVPDGELNRPDRRSFVVLVDEQHRCYVSDGRRFVDRAGRRTGSQPVSSGQILDDLTVGIIWAATNTDVALLADDAQLSSGVGRLARYEGRCLSEVPLTEVPRLNPVASQWLGSWFCTRRTVRSFDRLACQPCLRTNERRGEEAASWLLWRHRFEYLRRTARWFQGIRCGFSVAETDIADSPMYERVLLLLAVALKETFGIAVVLRSGPERVDVDGCALSGGATAANWFDGPAVCCVAASQDPFPGATVAEQTSRDRLEEIANRLEVPWPWFQRRCEELAIAGVDGIAHLRSRLLSTRGLNAAIRYVAYINDA
ncbi:hypothetical protein AB0E63_33675 [Kribbella sp. NPDC026596]|uniref:hypothetical protein n=1 Tax=Kribbella sp. NPDC026596 TaxID=3155122 RepID=UPI00340ED7E0